MSFRFHLIMVIKFYLVLDLKGFAPFLSSSRSINISAIFYLFSRTFLIIYLIKSNNAAPTKPANTAYLNISLSPPYCYKSYLSYLKQNPKWKELIVLLRKEVIQPHLPIRLPCYDFTPVIDPTFDCCLLMVSSQASGIAYSHGVTGGVYKTRERIHRSILICDY